jgi:hypothetical protein
MVSGWVPSKSVSDSPTLHLRWLLLLKIEISSIVHCCFSINQISLLEGTHPETIPARFGLIWFSSFRGEDLNVIFYQIMPNLHNPDSPTLHLRWLLLLKIEISSIVHCCFSINQI